VSGELLESEAFRNVGKTAEDIDMDIASRHQKWRGLQGLRQARLRPTVQTAPTPHCNGHGEIGEIRMLKSWAYVNVMEG